MCEKLLTNNWNYVWNDQQRVPFAYASKSKDASSQLPIEWVGFDDVRSIEVKVKYIMDRKLAGAMIWSLDMDDFTGDFCNQGKYPLLSTVNFYLNPNGNVQKLPDESVIRKNSSLDTDKMVTGSSRPSVKSEYDFFAEHTDKNIKNTFNVFSLINNDGN